MTTTGTKDFAELPTCLNCEDVAAILGISRAGAYKLARKEGFPSVIIGEKRIVIPRDRFIAWLEEQCD